MGEARHHTAGEGETGKPPKARDQEKGKGGKPWERGRLMEGKLQGKGKGERTERRERKWKPGRREPAPTVTHGAAEARAPR